MNQGRIHDSSYALKNLPLKDINSNPLPNWSRQHGVQKISDKSDNLLDDDYKSWKSRSGDIIIDSFLENSNDYPTGADANEINDSIRKILKDTREFLKSSENVTFRNETDNLIDNNHSPTSSEELSHLLQNYPHLLRNQRIADFLLDPYSGITPSIVLNSLQRQRQKREEERLKASSASEPVYHMMAATAKHTRDKFDAGEEDIAAIAKQISDHAEAIYQTWKSRGLAPTEILNCHTSQNAADEFGTALTPQNSTLSPVSELLAQAPNMDNNNLEKLVNNFVNEDKARIAAQRNKSPSRTLPSSIQFALQKFEKNATPTSPASNSSFLQKPSTKSVSSPVKPNAPQSNPPAYSPKPIPGVKPQIPPKNFNLIQPDQSSTETIEVTYPPDIVPQKPEAPKRPAGLSLHSPPNLQTWPLKNKVVDNRLQKSGNVPNNESPQKNDINKMSPKPDKFSTMPGSPKPSSTAYMDEVAREEERLINALKTGVVLTKDQDSVPFASKARNVLIKKESSPIRDLSNGSSVKPDLIPNEKTVASKDEKDGAPHPSVSLVDYAKKQYKDNIENPLTQQRLDANKQLDIDRKALMIDPALGLQVMETRSKFENGNFDKNDKDTSVAPLGRWGTPRLGSRRLGADQVPHPELTTQQKQHIRAQADKVASSPVRPFLTRGSVAERVLIFEKCPSELMLDKRKTPAINSWRTGHDVMAKAQTYGAGRCFSAPASTTASATPSSRTHRPSVSALPPSVGGRRAPIPRFHFPKGRPPPQSSIDQSVLRVQSAFATFPNSQVSRENFHHIVKACECPLYWKAPLFLATQKNLHSPVDGHKFIDFWRQTISQCHDPASRFIHILTKGAGDTLGPEELAPLVQDVVDTHPGLSFLKEATEFHSRYVHTVIARIFYCVNRSWSGRITVTELRRSDLLQVLQLLEEEEDINQITAYFSYEHFYVIYCKFWELDRDHDLFIDKHDLARHNDHALSSRMIDRVLSGCVTRGARRTTHRDGEEPRMSYTEFVWFLLAEEDKQYPTAIEYWFRCMDLDGDGYISMYELEYFYEEQMHRMEAIGIETLPFQDCLCQMLDMVQPKNRDKVTLGDLKRCKMTPIFFDTFFNLEKYLDHEQRDPFASQRDHDADGRELSEWDRFAAEEYELLVAEEGGSDAQDQVSYDETDDDCLSPNLDEILTTEMVDETTISFPSPRQNSEQKSPIYSSSKPEQDINAGFSAITSLYKIPSVESAVLSKSCDGLNKNIFLDNMSPTRQRSLNLNTALRLSPDSEANASFLYSQLLSPTRKTSPDRENGRSLVSSYSSDTVTTRIKDLGIQHGSTVTSDRPSFSVNKSADNYERSSVSLKKITPKELSAMNRVGLFDKETGLQSPKTIKVVTSNNDDDEDYSRDSDECSI